MKPHPQAEDEVVIPRLSQITMNQRFRPVYVRNSAKHIIKTGIMLRARNAVGGIVDGIRPSHAADPTSIPKLAVGPTVVVPRVVVEHCRGIHEKEAVVVVVGGMVKR